MNASNLSDCNQAVDMVEFVMAYLDGAANTMRADPDYPRNLLDPYLIDTAFIVLRDARKKLQDALMYEMSDEDRAKMARAEQRRQTAIEEGKELSVAEISGIMDKGGLMYDVPLTRGVLAAMKNDPAGLRAFLGVDPEPAKGNSGEVAS